MTDTAIKVENLSKRYRIGAEEEQHETLVGALAAWARSPLHNYRRLKKLSTFGANGENDDILWALRDVSFEVERGEVVGVIGRNGAGKSTLLKVLSRITEPTSGYAEIRGRVSSLLEVGTGFHQELTGRENVYLNGTVLGMTKREVDRKFDEIVAFSGVEKFIDTPVKRYSSGMKVRLAFAVAAHLEPEILLIDEVLAVGDVGFQQKCLDKMDEVTREGRTIVFVSHQMGAIKSLCSRVILIEDGQAISDGPMQDVVDEYVQLVSKERTSTLTGPISDDSNFERKSLDARLIPIDGNGKRELALDCGDEINLRFRVELSRPMDQLAVGINIDTMAGETIVGMGSRVQRVQSQPGPSTRWDIAINMGDLPLNAGRYSVIVYIGESDRDVACFPNAFYLHVRKHDVFGWGRALPGQKSWGNIYWDPHWEIRPAFNLESETQPLIAESDTECR